MKTDVRASAGTALSGVDTTEADSQSLLSRLVGLGTEDRAIAQRDNANPARSGGEGFFQSIGGSASRVVAEMSGASHEKARGKDQVEGDPHSTKESGVQGRLSELKEILGRIKSAPIKEEDLKAAEAILHQIPPEAGGFERSFEAVQARKIVLSQLSPQDRARLIEERVEYVAAMESYKSGLEFNSRNFHSAIPLTQPVHPELSKGWKQFNEWTKFEIDRARRLAEKSVDDRATDEPTDVLKLEREIQVHNKVATELSKRIEAFRGKAPSLELPQGRR